jgi:hypothetical protein
VTMDNSEEEVIPLTQKSFNSADDERAVRIADLFGDYADRVCAFLPERTGEKIGTVLQLASGGMNSCLGTLRNGTGCGRVVQHRRYSSGGKPNALGNGSKRYRCGFFGSRLIAKAHQKDL